MLRRNIELLVAEALSDTPVVFIGGARQTGKSTIAQALVQQGRLQRYLTLDDALVASAATTDPQGFLAGLEGAVVLDEVQRAPGLFVALKAAVDRDRRPGRFLLTGSADVMLLPRLADALVGRMEALTLWPLSQGELAGRTERFVDALFEDARLGAPRGVETREQVAVRVVGGGYPEALGRASGARRRAWYGGYVTTLLQRDVRDLAAIDDLAAMPRLLALVAARTGTLLNYSELARSAGMPQSTLKRYFALLEGTFLVQTLPAWSRNLGKRWVRSPKVHLVDTGLATHLTGVTADRLLADPVLLGPLLENFVVSEVRKQVGWSVTRPALFHYRTHAGHEVDLVLEDAAGRVVGVEIKARATLDAGDFRGLRDLAEAAGDSFHRGVVLHLGPEAVPFGERLHALPIDALWML